jgi:hypothetical protein
VEKSELYWNLYTELRKEIIESQKIRAQVIGFKITFISAAIGLLSSKFEQIPNVLLVIPAIASVFFDFLINSYSFAIKKIGYYLREILEPNLKLEANLPQDFTTWQIFLRDPKSGHPMAFISNYGVTVLASTAAVIALFFPFHLIWSPLLIILLIILLIFDYKSFRARDIWRETKVLNSDFESMGAKPQKPIGTKLKK